MDAKDREAHLLDRTLSCRVPDLGVTFLTRLGPDGAEPIRVADNGAPQPRCDSPPTATPWWPSPADPGSFMRAWLSGKLKVQGSVLDLLHLRKLM